jgi:hypothetical protein
MNEFFTKTDILLLIISILISVTIGIVTVLLSKFLRKTRYNDIEKHIELESIRNSIEKEIYKLNERLISNEERWKDVNHLLIRKDIASSISSFELNRKTQLNNFLKSNGITEKDLEIDKKMVFVLSPFNDQYYRDFITIKNVCTNVGLNCIRGDEFFTTGDIFSTILKNILKANLIIANINGRNPNVLYELGISQAIDKPTILIAKSINDLPIDVKSKRFLIYKDFIELELLLKEELLKVYSSI